MGVKCSSILTFLLIIFVIWMLHDYKDTGKHPKHVATNSNEETPSKQSTINRYDLNNPAIDTFDCLDMPVNPQTKVCIYPTNVDQVISGFIKFRGMWEPEIVSHFQKWLQDDEDLGVIDIGSHIGVYTLTAAAMGRSVVAVEPLHDSNMRLHKAAQLNGFQDKITLFQNAVSDQRRTMTLEYDETNRGHTVVRNTDNSNDNINGEDTTSSILFDDILPYCNFDTAIVKIDIEGHEHRALASSQVLLRALDVPFIMMEWEWLGGMLRGEVQHTEEDIKLIADMVDMLEALDYDPMSYEDGTILKKRLMKDWPLHIYWEKEYSEEYDDL